ncbi:Hypothetical protein MVR_LOCUS29 [uncultured virus]|nr:Hypothetical protein MVR_LOCUS29 [uncultured virus]
MDSPTKLGVLVRLAHEGIEHVHLEIKGQSANPLKRRQSTKRVSQDWLMMIGCDVKPE